MATQEEPQYVADTLAWCNEMRALKNKEPLDRLPKGIKSDPESCPCGEATGLKVGMNSWSDPITDEEGALPSSVREFVRQFDWGHLPQYDGYVAVVAKF